MEFRLGSIPVRIHPAFFFIALFFASNLETPERIAIGVVVVFVAILLHELGHALMGKAFGLEPRIDLHGMGGLTSWDSGRNLSHGKSILVSLAGPVSGFLVYGALIVAFRLGLRVPAHPLAQLAFELFGYVTVVWGILNLLPLLPMDGGNVMRSFLHIVTKGRGEKPARIVSIVTGAAFIAFAIYARSLWIGFLGALFTYQNVQALRMGVPTVRVELSTAQAIQRAYAALDQQDGAAAVGILRPVLERPLPTELRQLALRLFAYGLLLEGSWRELMLVLEREKTTIGDAELERYATTARELERPEEAARIEALRAGA